jgi:hypothetical protein
MHGRSFSLGLAGLKFEAEDVSGRNWQPVLLKLEAPGTLGSPLGGH